MTTGLAELHFNWGEDTIVFTVEPSDRRRLKIMVMPDGEIRVLAPADAVYEEIAARVARRGGWIVRQLRDFDRWRPRTPPRQYESGETHLYLGRQYRLLVRTGEITDVRLDGDRLVMTMPSESTFTCKRALLQHWYSLQCHRLFPERLRTVFPPFARQGVSEPALIIRKMSQRWGSYTAKGRLVLNKDLIRATIQSIDYVIIHELAHAIEPDHGAAWRSLMTRLLPDWRDRKTELEARLL
jgi:predicted metal-dependent hydrolase